MHRTPLFLRSLIALLGLWVGFPSSVCQAVSYTITIDTTALATQTAPPAPFALDFQLIDGDGTVNNTVTLSDLDFGTGGSPTGSPTLTGGASGTLSSTVTLTDSSILNEFIQGFTPSSTDPLRFVVDLTTNVEPLTPDAFSVAILDSSGTGLATSFFDVLVQIDITDPLTISTFASDPNVAPPGCPTCPAINMAAPSVQPIATPVPEPGTLLLVVSGMGGLALLQFRRARGTRRLIGA